MAKWFALAGFLWFALVWWWWFTFGKSMSHKEELRIKRLEDVPCPSADDLE